MSNFLLTQIINYGAPLFALILFLGAIGVPIGASLLVIAAGAFSQQQILSWPLTALAGLAGAVLGDIFSYGIGHFAKVRVEDRFAASAAWKSAQLEFDKHGSLAIFFTRFLITAIAVPVNLIAAGSGFKFRRFLLYDITGEAVWIGLYGGLGYFFGSQWETVGAFLSNFGWLLLGVVILAAGIVLIRKAQNSNGKENVPEA
jgi:membrane protein DedA with SNARE-associated domain